MVAGATSQAKAEEPLSQRGHLVAEWKESWRPGLAALLGGAVGFPLYTALSSLFVIPLQTQFGWSRGQIAFVHGFGLAAAAAAPVLGRLVDRHGVRPVLLTGIAVTTACYLLFAMMTGSLPAYYAIYFFFNIFGVATTGLTYTRIISHAFKRTRGTALAIARLGLASTAALSPLLLFPILARYGSAGGYLFFAALQLIVALPLVLLWAPRERRGVPACASASAPEKASSAWRLPFAQPKILILTAAAICNYVPVAMLASQLQPLAMSKGLDATMAVATVSLMGLAAGVGALLSGMLVDRIWAPAVAVTINLFAGLGCLLLLPQDVEPLLLYGAVLLIGLGHGAETDIVAFMIARYFGIRVYGTIYGITVLGIAIGSAIGTSLIGAAHDRFGSYDLAIAACATLFLAAAGFYLAMGRYPQAVAD